MTITPSDRSGRLPAEFENGCLRPMNSRNALIGIESQRTGLVNAMRLVLVLFPAILLVACAGTGGGSGGPVVKRAQERWEAVLVNDYETAYEYYSPGFRSSQTRGDYELSMRLRKIHFREAKYQEQECQEDVCTLKFNVKYRIASPVPGLQAWESNTTLDEKWVRTQGQWWYLPDDG